MPTGGIKETKKIAAMVDAYDVALALYCPLRPIALAANLQLAAFCYNAFIQEKSLGIHYNQTNDWLDYVSNPEVFEFKNGVIKMLKGPGLAVEVNKAYVKAQSEKGHCWRNPIWRPAEGRCAEW